MTTHVLHWLTVAATALMALCELIAGDYRGFGNAAVALLGVGTVAHLKVWAAKVEPLAEAAAKALSMADTQEFPRLADGTAPPPTKPAA